ncbi:MAG: hypothetical protein WKG06_27225 [Segetibacter sp.]
MFTYNTLNQQWEAVSDTRDNLQSGKAYRLMVRGSRSTNMTQHDNNPPSSNTKLRATGTLTTGTVNRTLSGSTGDYNFVGNPYASPIDFDEVIKQANDIKPQYTVWDPGLNERGGYVTYIVGEGTHISTSDVNKNIQSGQAFFVQTNGGSPSIKFLESHKLSGNTNVFRDPSRITKLSVQLLLNLNGGMKNTADGVVVFFDNMFTTAIGNEDSYKFTNLDENLSIDRNGTELSMEGRPPVTADDTIPLRMWQFRQKSYYLQLTGSNFSPDVTAFVKDAYLHKETPVDLSTVTLLPFSITADSGFFCKRQV